MENQKGSINYLQSELDIATDCFKKQTRLTSNEKLVLQSLILTIANELKKIQNKLLKASIF